MSPPPKVCFSCGKAKNSLISRFYGQTIQTAVYLRKKQPVSVLGWPYSVCHKEDSDCVEGRSIFSSCFLFLPGEGGWGRNLCYLNCLVFSSPALSAFLQTGPVSPGICINGCGAETSASHSNSKVTFYENTHDSKCGTNTPAGGRGGR